MAPKGNQKGHQKVIPKGDQKGDQKVTPKGVQKGTPKWSPGEPLPRPGEARGRHSPGGGMARSLRSKAKTGRGKRDGLQL